jgi:predicted component of type VI protein secretion system
MVVFVSPDAAEWRLVHSVDARHGHDRINAASDSDPVTSRHQHTVGR